MVQTLEATSCSSRLFYSGNDGKLEFAIHYVFDSHLLQGGQERQFMLHRNMLMNNGSKHNDISAGRFCHSRNKLKLMSTFA